MRAAREAGIDFLDDARYDDHTGSAPIPSGYSEVVFGELFRAAGWSRNETAVANKLWWEYWLQQGAVEAIQQSLGRLGGAGRRTCRYWGVLNWSAALTEGGTSVIASP